MDANIFIKDITTEGKKITDIQFYGGWTIDLGGAGGESEVLVGNGIEFKVDKADELLKKGSSNYIKLNFPEGETTYDIVRLNGTVSDNKFILNNQNPILLTRSSHGGSLYSDIWVSANGTATLLLVFNGQGKYYNGYILTNGNKNIK